MVKLRIAIVVAAALLNCTALSADAFRCAGRGRPPAKAVRPNAKPGAARTPQEMFSGLKVDKFGIIRNQRGERIGIWGVDSNSLEINSADQGIDFSN